MNLTKTRIDAFKYQGAKLAHGHSRDIRWDDKITGFGVRLTLELLSTGLPKTARES